MLVLASDLDDEDSDSSGEASIYARMSSPKEGSGLLNPADKVSGKAWGRVAKFACCRANYPKSIFFIVGNEFCERFSYYGMRAILVVYLTKWLSFNADSATAIYHFFAMLCYFSPIFGAVLADGFLGKYKTILYISIVYGIGNIVMAATAVPPPEKIGPMIALLLIALGTGGIKPCVSAFGGDQFSPQQGKELMQFFSVFYFAINLGSLLSMLITPVLRADVHCIEESCYPLAFGVPAGLMVVAIIIFFAGRNMYKRYPPPGNVIGQMIGCISHAIVNRCKKGTGPKDHWLDYADDKYEVPFISDVRAVLHVLFLFIPLPLFWALFDQQGSRWTLQAMELNGRLGKTGHIQPDQMQALNPILIILLIPFFESCVYPVLNKCRIPNRPIQRMCAGMLLAGASFLIAGFLQLHVLETMDPPLGDHQVRVRVINVAPCPVNVTGNVMQGIVHIENSTARFKLPEGNYTATIKVARGINHACHLIPNVDRTFVEPNMPGGHGYDIVAAEKDGSMFANYFSYKLDKPRKGGAHVRVIFMHPVDGNNNQVFFDHAKDVDLRHVFNITHTYGTTHYQPVFPGKYNVYAPRNSTLMVKMDELMNVQSGGVYSVVFSRNPRATDQLTMHVFIDVNPNTISILWQIPQYFVITMGEIMFSITGLSFAYSQAPASMKSVLQAGWLLTTAVGNLIVVIVAESRIIENQALEFFVFAVAMAVVTAIFALMGYFYKYVPNTGDYENLDMDKNELIDPDESEPPAEKETGAPGSEAQE